MIVGTAAIMLPIIGSRRDPNPARQSKSALQPKSVEPNNAKPAVQLEPSGPGAFFNQPQKLSSALMPIGLQTSGWNPSKATPGKWLSMSSYVAFGSAGPTGLQNNIAYYVSGKSASRANDIRIVININNPGEKALAFERLTEASKTLFTAIKEPHPVDLVTALAEQKAALVNTSYGRVELIYEPSRIDTFKVIITDAQHLADQEQIRHSSANDFEASKALVARAAGYSATNLSGDGQPTQEDGHKSFLFKGRGKDLFFCEIYPDRSYKVKAALNGQFPFKYIAEGSLD